MKVQAILVAAAACAALSLPASAQDDRTQRILDRVETEFKESRTRLREEIRAIIREEIQRGKAPAPPAVKTPTPAPKPPEAAPSKKVYLGIVAGDLYDDERKSLGITGGIRIAEARGPAAQAGVKPGDVLLSLAGKPVSEETIGKLLEAHKPGDAIEAAVLRGKDRVKLTITLAERKD